MTSDAPLPVERPSAEPGSVLLAGHDVPIGRYTTVRRLLPHRNLRMVGAWCFVDAFGPDGGGGRQPHGMQIGPHPHTGLQTVTWLVEGQVVHRDSLGSEQTVRPGQLNLMTAGHGIAHSEQAAGGTPSSLHGLQLWLALPESSRHTAPRFEHHADLPRLRDGGVTLTVLVGSLDGAVSPAGAHTPLLAAELVWEGSGTYALPVDPAFEYAVLALSGSAEVGARRVGPGALLHLPEGRSSLHLRAAGPARLFVLGGAPFDEPLLMWWNFVGRTHEEIVQAREDWMRERHDGGARFARVAAGEDQPLPAPDMPTVRLKARDRHGRRQP